MQSQESSHWHRHMLEVRQYFWRNYLVHSVEGGLFMGGMTFLAGDTVLPTMIHTLGGPNWLISLTPTLMMMGFCLPPLFLAHWVEQRQRLKPVVVATGVFQRLPFLVAGVVLLLAGVLPNALTLTVVAAAPFVSGCVGGIGYPAWMELTSTVIPAQRRSSSSAARFVIAAAIGLCAGGVIKNVLADYPGLTGYAVLHFIALGFLLLSLLTFTLMRETRRPPNTNHIARSLRENLRSAPALIKNNPQLANFIRMRVCAMGIQIMIPFLAIHVLNTLSKDASYLGYLVTAQMSGSILGNFIAGYLGDRYGGRLPLLLAQGSLTLLCLATVVNHSAWGFDAIYFVLGMGGTMSNIGSNTLSIEISPLERRPTYLSLITIIVLPASLIAAAFSTAVREWLGTLGPAAALAAVAVAASLLFALRIKEPRHHPCARPAHAV